MAMHLVVIFARYLRYNYWWKNNFNSVILTINKQKFSIELLIMLPQLHNTPWRLLLRKEHHFQGCLAPFPGTTVSHVCCVLWAAFRENSIENFYLLRVRMTELKLFFHWWLYLRYLANKLNGQLGYVIYNYKIKNYNKQASRCIAINYVTRLIF